MGLSVGDRWISGRSAVLHDRTLKAWSGFGNVCMYMQANPQKQRRAPGIAASWGEFSALASVVDARLDRWLLDTHRLGLTDYRALEALSQETDKELRVSDLAQRLGLNQSSATRLVSRLEAKQLVRRDICLDDGRGVYAVITDAAEALIGEVRGPYEHHVHELLTAATTTLPHLDVRQLRAALREVAALIAS